MVEGGGPKQELRAEKNIFVSLKEREMMSADDSTVMAGTHSGTRLVRDRKPLWAQFKEGA